MNMQGIKALAQVNGIKPGSMNKSALIRAIQRAEGNQECFTTKDNCNDTGCLWWEDCTA